MADALTTLQQAFPFLSLKADEDGDVMLEGIPGNPDLRMLILDHEVDDYLKIPFDKLHGILGIRGYRLNDQIHVILGGRKAKRPSGDISLSVHMHFKGHDLKIQLIVEEEPDEKSIHYLLWGVPTASRLVIKGYKYVSDQMLSDDLRDITNAVLFDLHYNFGYFFEVAREIPASSRANSKKQTAKLPKKTLELTYKEYNPELLRYYATAEREQFPPFQFLSYYHVLEYFLDRSAYLAASQRIKALLMRPDFHLDPDHYTAEAVKILKLETERNTNDKIKVVRALRQFIELNDFVSFVKRANLEQHFSKLLVFDSMRLTLPAIDTSAESQFFDTLSKRIYSLRCSIVHSNPDFDENKAVPFVTNDRNLALLRDEISLVNFVAREVILKSVGAPA